MRAWSLSLGRYFGVELRLHALTLVLLPVLMTVGASTGAGGFRAFALWLLMLLAVLVREIGRTLALEAAGIPISRLVLLPTGATPPLDEPEVKLSEFRERLVALAGPVSNFGVGLTMALLMFAATSHVRLFERPWFSPGHLLRAAIWSQILLGGLNLLPAVPLDAGVLLRRQLQRVRGVNAGSRSAAGIGQSVALLLVVLGSAMANLWVVLMGVSVLLSSRAEGQAAVASATAETITVSEVMLREFATLSASDTLPDALRRTVPSLQDVFPVVRGPLLVGAVSREVLVTALRTDRNSYVQSVMTRTLEVVAADDLLLPALRRIQQQRSAQMLTVVADEQVIGILTPGHLQHAMASLGRARRLVRMASVRGE